MKISQNANIGKNVVIKDGVIIEDSVVIGDNCYIDYGTIIKNNVVIGNNSFIGARCILGEFLNDIILKKSNENPKLIIEENATIRSESIIYGGTKINRNFQSGHRVTIREYAEIDENVNIGTLSDIQGYCKIGKYTRLHSNVHIGQKSEIGDYVWIFPYVVLTNDPMPPSNELKGVTIKNFAVICTGSVVLPGIEVEENSLIGASSNVTKNVMKNTIVAGNPAKLMGNIEKIKNKDGFSHYPWQKNFDRGMPWENIGFEKWREKEIFQQGEGYVK